MRLVSDRKRGLTAPTTTNSTMMAPSTTNLLAIGREQPRQAGAPAARQPRSRAHAASASRVRQRHRGADRFRRRVARGRTRRRCARHSSPARGRSCRALPAIRSRSSGWPSPSRRELAHQRMDLRLGADIDAARRLVHDEDARLGRPAIWPAPPSADCRPTAARTICCGPSRADAEALRSNRARAALPCAASTMKPRCAASSSTVRRCSPQCVCGRIRPCRPRSSGT